MLPQNKQSCFWFGRDLIESGDLDPVYILIDEWEREPQVLYHYLMAYWCFYHMGTAAWITDAYVQMGEEGYWERFEQAAKSKDYPRCTERRHFRGAAAVKAYEYLKTEGVLPLMAPIVRQDFTTCSEVMKYVQEWRSFGPWIGFKVADMIERLNIAPIEFSVADVYLFESPLKGAEALRESLSAEVEDEDLPSWAVSTLIKRYEDLKAPPRYERAVGVQEAETVLCKWKSHLNNHYTLGEDIESCQKCLQAYPKSLISHQLLAVGEERVLWSPSPKECSTDVPL